MARWERAYRPFSAYTASAVQAVGLSATHLRGGSWNNNQDNARAVYRNNNNPNNRNNNIGFRVVLSGRPTPPSLFQWASAAGRMPGRPLLSGIGGFRKCRSSTLCRPRRRDREGADGSRPHGRKTPSGAYTTCKRVAKAARLQLMTT
ncbi:MAG: SUMF1/EgtB/PvdO family nonheme iron enzyme [Acidobacteriota bacterium]|nr:MAG: SUMF1/EgtB/PvdO family nonheme iron enzyme [Acidobacteriota bacterium]